MATYILSALLMELDGELWRCVMLFCDVVCWIVGSVTGKAQVRVVEDTSVFFSVSGD